MNLCYVQHRRLSLVFIRQLKNSEMQGLNNCNTFDRSTQFSVKKVQKHMRALSLLEILYTCSASLRRGVDIHRHPIARLICRP